MQTWQSEKSIDTSNISTELLVLTLEACRVGLFYSPISMGGNNVANFSHQHDSSQAWSVNIGSLFGLSESPKDAAGLLPYILEADQHILIESVAKAINEHVRESDCEYRIRRADNGEIRWLMSRLLLGLDEEGNARYLAATLFDITEQKEAQEDLRRKNSKLDTAQWHLIAALKAAGIAIFRYTLNLGW